MDKNKINGFMDQLNLFFIGAVKGEPVPNPMLGCGMILFVVGVVTTIAISGYLLFKVSPILQILFYGIWAIVVGIILIVLSLKAENHGNKV